MDARILRAALVAAAVGSLGAGYRTTNFIVSAPSSQIAHQVAESAETYRRNLAIEWLGHEMPRWPQPCPITVQVGRHLGAGGATSFMFDQGRPFGWRMSIQGSLERILDSVLPHEVTHTIFATHFGRPLPRWADEGACTTVEHNSEKAKQHQMLLSFLKSTPSRGIPFNQMFAMTEYPPDILPLYAQGHSLVRYLIEQGGKRKFIQFVGDGMRSNNWSAATAAHYDFQDLSDLQIRWLAWVREGCPALNSPAEDPTAPLASAGGDAQGWRARPNGLPPQGRLAAVPPARGKEQTGVPAQALVRGQDPPGFFDGGTSPASWYARQRDRAKAAAVQISSTASALTGSEPRIASLPRPIDPSREISSRPRATSRPQPLQRAQEKVLQWNDSPATQLRRKMSADATKPGQVETRPPTSHILFDAPIRKSNTFWR